MHAFFQKFAMSIARAVGSPAAFFSGVLLVAAWAAMGPYFRYSENWQLIINTSTTIITFLMVFIIQYSQNRDTEALHLKIDELIRATKEARNDMVAIEEGSDDQLAKLKAEFRALSKEPAD